MMEMTLQFSGDKMIANLPQGPLTIGLEAGSNNPGELVLGAVVGCSAAVLKIILEKKRITYDELRTKATLIDDPSHEPTIMTGIDVHFSIVNPSKELPALEIALEQAVNNCPIVQSLKSSLIIKESIKIIA